MDGQSKTITSAAFILGATSIFSGLLGMFRDRLLASTFGAGNELDAFYAAFRVPDFVYSFLIFGALSGGFIPVFTAHLKKDETERYHANRDAWRLVNIFLNFFLTALIFVSAILIIFAPGITVLLTPGFPPDKMALTVKLTRIIFLETMLLSISGIFGAVLQSFKRFFLFSLASAVYNVGIIIGIVFFVKYWGIMGVAMGVVLGAFLHMAIQLPSVLNLGYRYKFILNFYHHDFLKILKLMVPRSLSLGVSQLNYLMMTVLASSLAVGSLAIFNFSYNIVTLPLGIIGSSFAIAAFPTLCEAFHSDDWKKFKESFASAFRQIIFFTLPISCFLIVLRAQIVRVLLGAGKFNWENTIQTIDALQFFAFTLLFDSLSLLLIRAFLAREDSRLPLFVAFSGSLIRMGTALILSWFMGVSGLTLGFTIGSFFSLILYWAFFKWRVKKSLDEQGIFIATLKIALASLLASSMAYLTLHFIAPAVNMQTGFGILLQGAVAGLIGIFTFIFFGLYFKSIEMINLWNVLVRYLPSHRFSPKISEPLDGFKRK